MYNRLRRVAEVPAFENPVLLYGLSGFLEAGAAVRIATEHILESVESYPVASFDIDMLFDYRGRRPRATFASDHYASIDMPSLTISACRDERGAGFFVLHGAEPDTGWQAVVSDIAHFIVDAGISLTVGMMAVPFPAPHTRPVAVTAHANRTDLLQGRHSWVGEMEVPASMAGFLEYHLGERGLPAMGFAAHVPHYLAQHMHPASALALVREAAIATGLMLPTDRLREMAERADIELNESLANNTENLEGVQQLEEQFDALVAERASDGTGQNPVDAETIAAQVEQFLAQMDTRGNPEA